MTKADTLIGILLRQVGKRYVFGHEVRLDDPHPTAFDCSELTQWAYHQVGITIPDGSFNQARFGEAIDLHAAQRTQGALVFIAHNGAVKHVGTSLGDGTVVEAKGRLFGVVRSQFTPGKRWTFARMIRELYPKAEAPAEPPTKPVLLVVDGLVAMTLQAVAVTWTPETGERWGKLQVRTR